MRDIRRMPVALRMCTLFFEMHQNCSIPELQYALAGTVSECYDSIGNSHSAIHWAADALKFAEQSQNKDLIAEAECELDILFSANKLIPELRDTTGYVQKTFNEDRKSLLQMKYHEADETRRYNEQWKYAYELMSFELDSQLKSCLALTGALVLQSQGATSTDGARRSHLAEDIVP